MARRPTAKTDGKTANGGASLEARLWQTADALGNNMDAAECKHVVLGLLLPKLISGELRLKDAERIVAKVA